MKQLCKQEYIASDCTGMIKVKEKIKMKYVLIAVCIILSLFYTIVWSVTEDDKYESSAIASSIYFLCFILVYIFT